MAKKVSVALADWRLSAFNPQMRGVDKITHEPTEMDASKYEELQKRASKVDVSLTATDASEQTTEEEGE